MQLAMGEFEVKKTFLEIRCGAASQPGRNRSCSVESSINPPRPQRQAVQTSGGDAQGPMASFSNARPMMQASSSSSPALNSNWMTWANPPANCEVYNAHAPRGKQTFECNTWQDMDEATEHPESCRPCADWHNKGRCRKELKCVFCHLPHDGIPKLPPRLEKKERHMMKQYEQRIQTLEHCIQALEEENVSLRHQFLEVRPVLG